MLENEAGAAIEASLMALFHVMLARPLWLRGQLRDDEVSGGLPDAARDQNPRSTAATRPSRG